MTLQFLLAWSQVTTGYNYMEGHVFFLFLVFVVFVLDVFCFCLFAAFLAFPVFLCLCYALPCFFASL